MANEEHLRILKQGVQIWNAWRRSTDDAPDLSGVSLFDTNLRGASLSGCNLNGSYLIGADLSGASVKETNLSGAKLTSATLVNTQLTGADLSSSDLSSANLESTNFHQCNLEGARLRGADLENADLTEANLRDTDLRRTCLVGAKLDKADLTGAKLWAGQHESWSIKDISCEWAFWDRGAENRTKYRKGEFEQAFAEKPQIYLSYPEGMSPIDVASLPLIVERLQAKHSDSKLSIRSIQDEGHGAVVAITVDDLSDSSVENLEPQLEKLRQELQYLQGQRDAFKAYMKPLFKEILTMSKTQINISQIHGPTVVQGNQHVKSVSYTTSDLVEIRRYVKELLIDHSQWKVHVADADRQEEFQTQLNKLKQELAKKEPDQSMVSAGLGSLKNMLESAAGTAIYGGSLAALTALAG